MPEPIVGGLYQHWKGPLYLVLGVATDSNNTGPHPEPQVVYVSVDTSSSWPFHIRSLSEFSERFTPVSTLPTPEPRPEAQ